MDTTAFAPSPPADLVLPAPGSTTARAIFSMGRRQRFERLKGRAASHGPLAALLDRFLPGRPHAVAARLDDPAVNARLARSLRAPDDVGLLDALHAQLAYGLAMAGALPAPVPIRGSAPLEAPTLGWRRENPGTRLTGGPGPEDLRAHALAFPDADLRARFGRSEPSPTFRAALAGELVALGERLPELRRELPRSMHLVFQAPAPEAMAEAPGALRVRLDAARPGLGLARAHTAAKLDALAALVPLARDADAERGLRRGALALVASRFGETRPVPLPDEGALSPVGRGVAAELARYAS